MVGTNAVTGKPLSEIAHLKQSIRDILTTPIGSRVMRRDYGSRLPELVDAPMNALTIAQIYFETVDAVLRWETRIQPIEIRLVSATPGRIELNLKAAYVPTGEVINMDGLTVDL